MKLGSKITAVELHLPVKDVQRRRLLDAMAEIVGEKGYASATVTAICARAGLSRQTFYQRFDGRETCFLGVLDEAHGQGAAVIIQAFRSSVTWRDGLREAFASLLLLFESRPGLARIWMIESITAGSWAFAHREKLILGLTETIVNYWEAPPALARHSDPMVASTIMSAAVAAIQRHLLTAPEEPLIDLLGPLMGIATGPFLDPAQTAAEVRRGAELAQEVSAETRHPTAVPDPDLPSIPPRVLDPRAYRARAALCYLVSHPDASNRELARGIGMASDTQMSTLISRLVDMGVIHKHSGSPGFSNSCRLTASGERAAAALQGLQEQEVTQLTDTATINVKS